MSSSDSIYTARTLHTLPHRLRVQQIISVLQKQASPSDTYADVGCGDGFVTAKIAKALHCSRCDGYDFNSEVLDFGRQRYPEINFHRWNLAAEPVPAEKYSLVTCLETLEHVVDVRAAVRNLVSITERLLLITVPIEIGPIGFAKFTAKIMLGRETFTKEHEGSKSTYFWNLLRGAPISHFRKHPENGHWQLHTGFDYRELDKILGEERIAFQAQNRGWNRFYWIRQIIANCTSSSAIVHEAFR
jgi:2-polyprenyl-3-methyl-5-hydroxy-6-metoxy-1,4-benzoquinol methylase